MEGIRKYAKLIVCVALVGIALGGAVFFAKKYQTKYIEPIAIKSAAEIVNYEFPEILINIGAGKFIKTSLIFELENQEQLALAKKLTPRILDRFQVYLRELHLADIEGPGGMERLREELLHRLNETLFPQKAYNILFKQFVIQ